MTVIDTFCGAGICSPILGEKKLGYCAQLKRFSYKQETFSLLHVFCFVGWTVYFNISVGIVLMCIVNSTSVNELSV